MKFVNNPFKLILPLFLLLNAFSINGQMRTKVKSLGGNTGGDCYQLEIGFSFFTPNWSSPTSTGAVDPETGTATTFNGLSYPEPPCDIHIGVTVENSDPIIEYFFPIDFDFSELDPINGVEQNTDIGIPANDIEEQFCNEGIDEVVLNINLYCLDDEGNFTAINPCDEDFCPFFMSNDNCDNLASSNCPSLLSGDLVVPSCCSESEYNEESDSEESSGSDDDTHLRGAMIDKNELLDIQFTYESIKIFNEAHQEFDYQIVDICGKQFSNGKIESGSDTKSIDLSNLQAGLYIFTYGNNEIRKSMKFFR